jgi:23S rRNA (adenine2030-N6)-methyltransferase
LNYRHAYRAGNFADVHKHAVVTRIIEYLKRKDAAFRVIDTHAGAGLYNLGGVESAKTGEWMTGIGRLLDATLSAEVESLLAPWLEVVRAYRQDGQLAAYPGSPLIIRRLLRKQDRLSAFELHEEDFATLSSLFAGDFQTRVTRLDGWLVPGAHLPPKEKRGLVLIDPPFEKEGEFARLADALAKGHRRWPGGMFCLWYPLKRGNAFETFIADLKRSGLPDLVRIELDVDPSGKGPVQGLSGSGLIVKNPPYVLEAEMAVLMPELVRIVGQTATADWKFERLTEE